jgi:GNAT superfamily N-acetyltransferase
VHVAEAMRGKKIGQAMMRWAIDEAKRRGCFRIQLTSNKARTDAHRFYERLGFESSHIGFKMTFDD